MLLLFLTRVVKFYLRVVNLFSVCVCVCVCVCFFHFSFRRRDVALIVIIPDHNLSFYFFKTDKYEYNNYAQQRK